MTPIGCHYYFISDITHARRSMIFILLFALYFTIPWWYFDAVAVFIHTLTVFLVSVGLIHFCNSG